MRDIDAYANAYSADYGFESVMVHYRRRQILDTLRAYRPNTVVEVGCGSEFLYKHYIAQNGVAERWIIVEPSVNFAEAARAANMPNAVILQMGIEEAATSIATLLGGPPDQVICSSLLHEVADADRVVACIAGLLGSSGRLHVNVPNAGSMHRRLAVAMGLIKDASELSARNQSLQQHNVFTIDTLKSLLDRHQLVPDDMDGYLIKPFTHKQMEDICVILGTDEQSVLDGLNKLGRAYPEWASEIYINAKRKLT